MTTIRDQIKAAIFGQESSSGAADTSQENYAGARGPMQVTRSTFDGLQAKGLIPKDWRHDNPEQTTKAGNILIDTLADKYNDDPTKVAAAYYAGEKAVRPDGSIADFRDRKNPKAPTTLQYVQQVMTRMGLTPEALEAGGGPAAGAVPRANVLDSWTQGMPDKTGMGRKGVYGKDAPEPPPSDTTQLPGGNPLADALGTETQRLQGLRSEIDNTSFLDKARAGWMHSGIAGAALKQATMPKFEPATGYMPRVQDKKLYEGKTEDDQALLDEATSPMDAQYRSMMIERRNEDLRTVNLSGAGVGIAATLFGGLPEGYLTGLGAMKAFQLTKISALRYAQQGQLGKAVGASVLENLTGNIATTALQQAFDPYVGKDDYAMAAGMSLVGAGLHFHTLKQEADGFKLRDLGNKIMGDAATSIDATRAKAVANLGENATPEALLTEMRRLEATDIRNEITQGTAQLPESRRLLPEMEEATSAEKGPSGWDSVGTSTEKPSSNALAGMETTAPRWDNPAMTEARVQAANMEGSGMSQSLHRITEGNAKTLSELEAKYAPGVTVLPSAAEATVLAPAIRAIKDVASQFLPPDVRVLVGTATGTPQGAKSAALGEIVSVGKSHVIGLKPENQSPSGVMRTAMHEVGHAVFHHHAQDIPPSLLERMKADYSKFTDALVAGDPAAREKRYSITSKHADASGPMQVNKYTASFDEYAAEQFVKHIEREAATGADGVKFTDSVRKMIVNLVDQMKEFFGFARGKGYLSPDDSFSEFFTSAMNNELKAAKEAELSAPKAASTSGEASSFSVAPTNTQNIVTTIASDPIAQKYGLTLFPMDTPQQRAEAQAVLHLYKKADAWAKTNPIDESRLKSLTDNSVFNVASTGLLMLKSENPVVRMVASELMESASGAAGRRSTAAIAKHLNERAYMGNSINELQSHYTEWRNLQGGNAVGDFWDGKHWQQFNRLLAEEIESRQPGRTPIGSPPQVVNAANMLEQAYDRMRVAQTTAKTVGWASLPESSVGYMPHRMSPEKVRNMTNAQAEALHSALVDQFIQIEGYDITFSANLASKYIDRIRRRALGGFEAPTGVHQVGAADVVQEALESMGMARQEVTAMMGKYQAGGMGHTKRRLQLDLNAEHADGNGGTFKLMDLFETDQLKLLRSQAQRVSGEVALARHGVMGKPGLALLRRAMEFGEDMKKATAKELEAFDQVSAEFLGAPFGDHGSMWMNRAMQVNSLARLGGMGFTQFAEFINGITHIGAGRTMTAISGMVRLRNEAKALARGEKVENPILSSIEKHGGAEFGTDAYKMVFPFDNGELHYQTYGKDTLTFADRALRGATHLQGKLSFWRAIHSAQHRGMAEQIVHKAVGYIRNGGESAALKDMGITAEVADRLRKDLGSMAEFDGAGNLQRFDITKATDLDAADQFVQAVHRGTSQIIQGTYIGETGKWAHSGWMKLLTQFRSFSITSVEKQWSRQVGNHGPAAALGILMGSMSIAAPIYIARTQLAAIGRKDKDEYLEKQLSATQVARATLNYIAMSGLAGDFMDAFTAVSGVGQATGGRTNAGSRFVGNVVAPAAGLADDIWQGIQNTKEGTDPHQLLKSLPFARLPYMIPVIEGLGR
jgi:hypothetical protein